MTADDEARCALCEQPMARYVTKTRKLRTYCSPECAATGIRTRDYYVTEVEWLIEAGTAPAEIATRLGVKPASLLRALERAQRYDLAKVVRCVVERRHPCADCATLVHDRYARCRSCAAKARRNASVAA